MKKPIFMAFGLLVSSILFAQNSDSKYTISALSCTKSTIEQGQSAWFSFAFTNNNADFLFFECDLSAYWSKDTLYSGYDNFVKKFDSFVLPPGGTLVHSSKLQIPVTMAPGQYYLMIRAATNNWWCGNLGPDQLLSIPVNVVKSTGFPCIKTIASGKLVSSGYKTDGSFQFLVEKDNTYSAYCIDTAGQTAATSLPQFPDQVLYSVENNKIIRKNASGTVLSTISIPNSVSSAYHKLLSATEAGSDIILTAFKNAPFYPANGPFNTADLGLTILRFDQSFNLLAQKVYTTKHIHAPSLLTIANNRIALGYVTSSEPSMCSGILEIIDLNLAVLWKNTTGFMEVFGGGAYLSSPVLRSLPNGVYTYDTKYVRNHGSYSYSEGNGTYYAHFNGNELITDYVLSKYRFESYQPSSLSWNNYAYRFLSDSTIYSAYVDGNGYNTLIPPSYQLSHLVDSVAVWSADTFYYDLYPFRELLHLGSKYYILNENLGQITLTDLTCNNTVTVSTDLPDTDDPGSDLQSCIRVFPNPARQFINIAGISGSCQVMLYALDGKLMLQQSANTDGALYLHLPDIEAGYYFLRIQTKDGSATVKIIME